MPSVPMRADACPRCWRCHICVSCTGSGASALSRPQYRSLHFSQLAFHVCRMSSFGYLQLEMVVHSIQIPVRLLRSPFDPILRGRCGLLALYLYLY